MSIAVTALEPTLAEVIISYEGEYDEESGEYTGQALARFDNECSYEGTFQKGLFHGKGKFVWPDTVTFEGDFQHNALTGKGSYTYADGSVYFGDVLDGKRHGMGKLTTSAGQVYEGEWKHGLRHGKGKMVYNTENTIIYTGEWVANNREGYGIMEYPSTNSYEGEWKADHKEGYGTMIWKAIDEVYTGHWSLDLPHGFGEHVWGESNVKTVKRQNCNIYRGDFQAGLRHGKGTFYYANGSQYTGHWAGNMKNGLGVFLFTDNRISVGEYENNKLLTGVDTQNLLQTRDSGDISAQFYLNILDILTSYPGIASGSVGEEVLLSQRKQYVKELERLLLKYNQYIKNTYKHYTEAANRHRQREILVVPSREHYHSENKYKIAIAAIKARKLHKRLFCMNIETMLRFLRDVAVVDIYFTAEDLSKLVKKMRSNRMKVVMDLYKAHVQSTLPTPPEGAAVLIDNAQFKQMLAEADLSCGELVDAYLDPLGHDADFPVAGNQAILEHEFMELLVRVVSEAYARRGHINVDLYQILSKLLHQKVLPLLAEGDNPRPIPAQQLYIDGVQDLLKNRQVTPHHALGTLLGTKAVAAKLHHGSSTLHAPKELVHHAVEVREADKIKLNKIEELWMQFKAGGKRGRTSKLVQGGAVRGETIISYLLSQRGVLVDAQTTSEQLFKVIHGDHTLHSSDLPWSRLLNYEDYTELLCRVVSSDLWVTPVVEPSIVDANAASEEVKSDWKTIDNSSSTTISVLQERLTRFVHV